MVLYITIFLETEPIHQFTAKVPERKPAKKRKFVPEWEEDLTTMLPECSNSGHSSPAEPGLQRQESFQASSWPPLSQMPAWEHVCLCYNLVGVVTSHRPPGAAEAEDEKKHFNFLLEVSEFSRSFCSIRLVHPIR